MLSGALAGHQHLNKLSFAGSSLGDDNLKVKHPYDKRQYLQTLPVKICSQAACYTSNQLPCLHSRGLWLDHQTELGSQDAMWLLSGIGTGASRQSKRAAAGAGRLQADGRRGNGRGENTPGTLLDKYLHRYKGCLLWHVLRLELENHSLPVPLPPAAG